MELNFNRNTVKMIVSGLVGLGTYKIARDAVKNNTDDSDNRLDQVAVPVASVAIASAASASTKTYSDQFIDQIFDAVDEMKNKVSGTPTEKS